MRRFRGTKAVIAVVSAGVVATLALACSDTESPGSVIVAVSTDFALPKDVDQVGLFINADGKPVFSDVEPVVGGQVKFPATLAVTHNGNARPVLRVRAVAFSKGNVRVLRDALTTIPETRHVTLRMPLQFLADGSGTGPSPLGGGEVATTDGGTSAEGGPGLASLSPTFEPFLDVVSTCPAQDGKLMTSVAGTCVPAEIDENSLPEHDDAKVFGGAVAPESAELQAHGACFDAKACFTTAFDVQPDAECTLPLPLGGTNIAVRTTGGAGECVGGTCYVPLDYFPASASGRGAGFWIEGNRAHLPTGLCAKMKASPGTIGVAVGAGCNDRWKVESVPLCGPFSATDGTGALPTDALVPEAERAFIVGDGPSSIADAGPDDGDAGVSVAAPQLVAEALDPVDLRVNELGVFVAAVESAGRLPSVAFTLDDKVADCNHVAAAPVTVLPTAFTPDLTARKLATVPREMALRSPVMMLGRNAAGTKSNVFAANADFGAATPSFLQTKTGAVDPLVEDIAVYRSADQFHYGLAARIDLDGDSGIGSSLSTIIFSDSEIMIGIGNASSVRSLTSTRLTSGDTFGVIQNTPSTSPALYLIEAGAFTVGTGQFIFDLDAKKTRIALTPDQTGIVANYELNGKQYFRRIGVDFNSSSQSLPLDIQTDSDGNGRGFDVDDTHVYFARTSGASESAGIYRLPLANIGQKAELVQLLPPDRLINGVVLFGGAVFWTERPTTIGTTSLGAVRCKRLAP